VTGSPSAPTIGVDLGGTNLRIGAVDAVGTIITEVRDDAPSKLDDLVDAIGSGVNALASAHGASAVGVGTAGMVSADGTVHYAPNLPMFVDVPFRALLADRLDLPVLVENDANVAAWGEHCHGAARGVGHALVITLGTGVGGGIIADGKLFRGAHGFAAEVGHWQFDPHGPRCACGEVGHWEAFASGTALGHLAREWAERGDAPKVLARAGGDAAAIRGEHVGASATDGEADGRAIIAEFSDRVALGCAGLANILDPELIVVSGGLVELGDVLLDPLRAAFLGHLEGSDHRPTVPIVAAALGDAAGMVGAAALARDLVQ
jgi:glucokinase